MTSFEGFDKSRFSDSVLTSLPYRELQQVAKQFGLPGNIKRDTMIVLIQARRDGKEGPITEFLNLRKELLHKKSTEKQENTMKNPYLSPHLSLLYKIKEKGELRKRILQKIYDRPNLPMTSHYSQMRPNLPHRPQQSYFPMHQYQQEYMRASEYPRLNVSDNTGTSYGHDVGEQGPYLREQNTYIDNHQLYRSQKETFPYHKISSTDDQSNSSDKDVDGRSSAHTEHSTVIIDNNNQNKNERAQMKQEFSRDGGMFSSFQAQQSLAQPSYMSMPYQESHTVLSSLYHQNTLMHTMQEDFIQQTSIPYQTNVSMNHEVLWHRSSAENSETSSIPEQKIDVSEKVMTVYSCQHKVNGCTKPLYNFQIIAHEKYCHSQIVKCVFKDNGCSWTNLLKFLSNHLHQDHSEKITYCPEKFTILCDDMFEEGFRSFYLQCYNQRIFLINLYCFDRHLYATMKFVPDGYPELSVGTIEIVEQYNEHGSEKPQMKWSGRMEPYQQQSSDWNSDCFTASVASLSTNLSIHTSVSLVFSTKYETLDLKPRLEIGFETL